MNLLFLFLTFCFFFHMYMTSKYLKYLSDVNTELSIKNKNLQEHLNYVINSLKELRKNQREMIGEYVSLHLD